MPSRLNRENVIYLRSFWGYTNRLLVTFIHFIYRLLTPEPTKWVCPKGQAPNGAQRGSVVTRRLLFQYLPAQRRPARAYYLGGVLRLQTAPPSTEPTTKPVFTCRPDQAPPLGGPSAQDVYRKEKDWACRSGFSTRTSSP